jgi:hypothetical protein
MKSTPGPPMMTLGNAAAAGGPAEQAARYGADSTRLPGARELVCSQCGGRQVDMVVTGERR